MSVIGEVALAALFEAKATSSDLLKIFQQEQVHVDLNKWKKTLSKINAVLDDAEEKRETSRLGKILLDELEELAYDADDILDEFATEVLRRRGAKSDAREMQRFYQDFYKKYIQDLQNAADKHDRAQLTKAYQTASVLFEVLKAIEMSIETLQAHAKVEEKKQLYKPYNILPLDPDSENQAIMRYPEIQASVSALRNIRGLPWPKDDQKKVNEDILDWLQAMFGFQMAFELYGMLDGRVSPMTGEPVKPVYGGDDEAFLKKVVTPIYETIAKEAKRRRGKAKHSQWRNYDDLNEYFWSVDCFRLGWPMRADADFFCQPLEKLRADKKFVCWKGLTVEVNEEGKRRVAWDYNKGGFNSFKWVIRSQKEHMVGLGTDCDTRSQVKPVVGSDPCCDTTVGLPHLLNPEFTGPIRFEVGESSSLADPRPLTHKAHESVMVASSKTGHDISVAQIKVMG
nr:callose synthase 2 [Quercus suber]